MVDFRRADFASSTLTNRLHIAVAARTWPMKVGGIDISIAVLDVDVAVKAAIRGRQ
jgi:hypothetical protein